jgi:hypothetical protein
MTIKLRPHPVNMNNELTMECRIEMTPVKLSAGHAGITLLPMELRHFPKPYDHPYQVANLIRRLIHSQVPTMALDTVEIQANDSSLLDELLAQRLGQIPICYPNLDSLIDSTQCSCSHGCPVCSREVHLDIIATRWMEPVMTNQLISDDPTLQPMPGITIAYLPRGGKIQLSGIVRKSGGSQHAKWSPVSNVIYTPTSLDPSNTDFTFQIELVGSISVAQLMGSVCQLLRDIFPSATITSD